MHSDEVVELREKLAAVLSKLLVQDDELRAIKAKLAAAEIAANGGLGISTPEAAAAGRGKAGTTGLAMNRMRQPREIEQAMSTSVDTAAIQQIVREMQRR